MAAAILMWFGKINVDQGFNMVHESFFSFIQDVHVPRFVSVLDCPSQDCRASWDTYLEANKRRRRC